MSLKCPVCRSRFTIAQAVHEKDMDEMVDLAAKFGKNWNLVFDYTECFRDSRWGSVGEKKRLRLLKDIDRLFEKVEFEYDGKRYRTDWVKILAALRVVVDVEKYGFKNHNYLKKVLMGEKAETVSAEGLTAKEEKEREKKVHGSRFTVNSEKTEPERISFAEFKRRNGIKSLTDAIGKKI